MSALLSRVCTGRWVSSCVLFCCTWLVVATASCQTLTAVTNLSFGTFAAPGAGTIGVNADGARLHAGLVIPINQGSQASAARFVVHGTANAVYGITMPQAGSVVLMDASGHKLTVQGFVSSLSGMDVLNMDGSGQFSVGATLAVGAAQPKGNYSGTFSLIVNYQ